MRESKPARTSPQDVTAGLRRVVTEGDIPATPISVASIHLHPTGEVTYKFHPADGGDVHSGYLPPLEGTSA